MQNRPIHPFLGSRTSENEAMSMKIICFVTFAEILGDPFGKILAFPLDFLSKCTGEQVAGPKNAPWGRERDSSIQWNNCDP